MKLDSTILKIYLEADSATQKKMRVALRREGRSIKDLKLSAEKSPSTVPKSKSKAEKANPKSKSRREKIEVIEPPKEKQLHIPTFLSEYVAFPVIVGDQFPAVKYKKNGKTLLGLVIYREDVRGIKWHVLRIDSKSNEIKTDIVKGSSLKPALLEPKEYERLHKIGEKAYKKDAPRRQKWWKKVGPHAISLA